MGGTAVRELLFKLKSIWTMSKNGSIMVASSGGGRKSIMFTLGELGGGGNPTITLMKIPIYSKLWVMRHSALTVVDGDPISMGRPLFMDTELLDRQ